MDLFHRRPLRRWLVRLADPPGRAAYYALVAARSDREAGRILHDTVSFVERAGFERLLNVEEVPGLPSARDLTRGRIELDALLACRFVMGSAVAEPMSRGVLPGGRDMALIEEWRATQGFEP